MTIRRLLSSIDGEVDTIHSEEIEHIPAFYRAPHEKSTNKVLRITTTAGETIG